jgi:hypothetical protein
MTEDLEVVGLAEPAEPLDSTISRDWAYALDYLRAMRDRDIRPTAPIEYGARWDRELLGTDGQRTTLTRDLSATLDDLLEEGLIYVSPVLGAQLRPRAIELLKEREHRRVTEAQDA